MLDRFLLVSSSQRKSFKKDSCLTKRSFNYRSLRMGSNWKINWKNSVLERKLVEAGDSWRVKGIKDSENIEGSYPYCLIQQMI